MAIQDYLAIATFAIALAGVVYQIGKQAQNIDTNTKDINRVGQKLDKLEDHLNALERDVYINISEIPRG